MKKAKITLSFTANLEAEEGEKEILNYVELIAKMQINEWLGNHKHDRVTDVQVTAEEIKT